MPYACKLKFKMRKLKKEIRNLPQFLEVRSQETQIGFCERQRGSGYLVGCMYRTGWPGSLKSELIAERVSDPLSII